MRKMSAMNAHEIELLTNDYMCTFHETIHDNYTMYNMTNENVLLHNFDNHNDIIVMSIAKMKLQMQYVELLRLFFDNLNMYFEYVDENEQSNVFNVHAFDKTTFEYVNARVLIRNDNVCVIV